MFSNLLDESQRYSAKDKEDSALFVGNSRGKFRKNNGPKRLGNKGPKHANSNKKCTYCDKKGHDESTCFKKNPKLRNGRFNKDKPENKYSKDSKEGSDTLFASIDFNNDNTSKADVLFSNIEDLDSVELNNNAVLSANSDYTREKSAKSTKFVLDSGASRYIIANRDYFINYTAKDTLLR